MSSLLSSTGRRCPSGRHVMDPGWSKCPYCDAEKRSNEQTAHRKPERIVSSDVRKTTIEDDSAHQSNRETKAMPRQTSSPNVGGYGDRGDKRRIRGILITYTWRPQGDLFPVREGKNYIGAGTVNREPGDPQCDIQITDDQKLSSAHALILCRHGRFEIVDLESTNGTFIDEEMIPIRGADLPDTANIRTGATSWTFMKVKVDTPDNKVSDNYDHPQKPTVTPAPDDGKIKEKVKKTKVR
ncbi:FHA domain-containing protein [Nitrosomonas sp.]|uniref:FHA domain-containing protein n=1 Tax=Nitrosomonas sp. TaxID=42353 RepID=UPI002088F474|nr:FHA domain-containing protein [Nitrosomonas sp.]GJL76414.1 MAG: hypothetical protein NMNS02_25200 [Nitrosomonas sp.]